MSLPILIGGFVVLVFLGSIAHGHTSEDLKREFGQVPESLARITIVYEQALQEGYRPNPELEPSQREAAIAHWKSLLSQLHLAQHEMLLETSKIPCLLTKCLELLEKIPAAERRLQKLEKAGQDIESEQRALDKMKAWTSIHCAPGSK